jgi:transposase
MRALQLSEQGWRQHDIAVAFSVTESAVSQWLAAARLGGLKALRSRPRRGRPLKLTSEQKRLIPDFLWHGPEAYGFWGKVWTCPRVAKVLQEEFQILYSKSQVSRLLKEIGWTPQVPLTRAIQRDEEAIQRWRVERWPEVKERARHERRTLVFTDESGFYLLPGGGVLILLDQAAFAHANS